MTTVKLDRGFDNFNEVFSYFPALCVCPACTGPTQCNITWGNWTWSQEESQWSTSRPWSSSTVSPSSMWVKQILVAVSVFFYFVHVFVFTNCRCCLSTELSDLVWLCTFSRLIFLACFCALALWSCRSVSWIVPGWCWVLRKGCLHLCPRFAHLHPNTGSKGCCQCARARAIGICYSFVML